MKESQRSLSRWLRPQTKEKQANFFHIRKIFFSFFFFLINNKYIWVIYRETSMMENEDSELGSQSISSSGSEKMIVPNEPSHSHISSLKMSACGASATSDSAYGGSNTTQSQRSGSDKRSHSSKSKSQISSNSSSKYVEKIRYCVGRLSLGRIGLSHGDCM